MALVWGFVWAVSFLSDASTILNRRTDRDRMFDLHGTVELKRRT
jgi:hypothetical protein